MLKLPEKLENVSLTINTEETIYDPFELSKKIHNQLEENNIKFLMNEDVLKIIEKDDGFNVISKNSEFNTRSIINSTYSNYNIFNNDLGLENKNYQYELTLVPIIEWREGLPPIGITLLDGSFFSVLPYGKSGKYTLYHGDYSVNKRIISELPPKNWQNPKSILSDSEAKTIYKKMVKSISKWLPSIKDSEFVSFLATTRMVLSNVDDTDARPSLMQKLDTKNCFYSLFSGKIDHSITVAKVLAKEVTMILSN